MTPPAAAAAAAAGHEFTMTARERVSAFLNTQPRAFCDACVARAVGIDPSTAYRVAVKIARSDGFVRRYDACSECAESRLVTSVCR